MALNATIHKVSLTIANMDIHYYQDHNLTIAQHPSETDERLMVRIVAFALFANEQLEFGKGVGADDEPALFKQDLTGKPELLIEIGLPDERRIRRACGRAKEVRLIVYGKRSASELWWKQNQYELLQKQNLTIILLEEHTTQALAKLADRSMTLSCTLDHDQIAFMNETETVNLELHYLKRAN